MKTVPILTGCLLLGAVAAQDTVPTPSKAPASAAKRLEELEVMKRSCIAEWRKATQAAAKAPPTPGKSAPAIPMRPDFAEVHSKAKACAEEYAGTEDAVGFLVFICGLEPDKARAALEILLRDHVDSPKLAAIGPMIPQLGFIGDAEFAAKARARLMQSQSVAVRGWTLLAEHKATIESGDRDGAVYKDARQKLLAVADEVADKMLQSEIRGAIDEREKFGIGCTAPDIVGVDLDGVEFKLSDSRGKVVFLDFWGDW